MRFGKYYKNTFSSITGVIGLVTVIIGLVGVIIGVVARLALVTIVGAANIIGLATAILQGVFFILLGVSFIILRSKIGCLKKFVLSKGENATSIARVLIVTRPKNMQNEKDSFLLSKYRTKNV